MDDKKKTIEISSSSLIDLKAELVRKQEEFKRKKLEKAAGGGSKQQKLVDKKPSIWDKRNQGVFQRSQKDFEEITEEINAFEASSKALQAKAQLYDKLTKGNLDLVEESDGKSYLVDFEQKVIDSIAEKRRAKLKSEEDEKKKKEDEEERKLLAETIAPAENPEEEWVDYVDSFGRSRKCLKKDLPHFEKLDRKFSNAKVVPQQSKADDAGPELISADMKRELERQKWEKEAEEALKGPVHYSNVQFNEIRDHGVGYFGFAKDEETRIQQLENLKTLRDQTKGQREMNQKLKEKRKSAMQIRLAKVKQRKIVQNAIDSGNLKILEDEVPSSDDDDDDLIGPLPEKKSTNEDAEVVLTRDDSWRKTAPVREWDKGKKFVYDEENWYEKRREERLSEFAPPSMYKHPSKPVRGRGPSFVQNKSALVSGQERNFQEMDSQERNTQVKNLQEMDSQEMRVPHTQVRNSNIEQLVSNNLHSIRSQMGESGNSKGIMDPSPVDVELRSIPLPRCAESTSVKDSVNKFKPEFARDNMFRPNTAGYDMSQSYYNQPNTAGYDMPRSDYIQPNAAGYDVSWSDYNRPNAAGYDMFPGCYNNQSLLSGVMFPPSGPPAMNAMNAYSNSNVEQIDEVTKRTASSETTVGHEFENSQPSFTSPQPVVAAPTPSLAAPQPTVAAPQPAHYSSAPARPQPKGPKYEPVYIHEVPLTLPAPPTAGLVVQYPSQEEVMGAKKSKGEVSEQDEIRSWHRQFNSRAGKMDSARTAASSGASNSASLLKPDHIPFASPYIQKVDGEHSKEDKAAAEFDPQKPPPPLN